MPDFLVRLAGPPARHLILEVKGFDPLEQVKAAAACRWVAAVNADGRHGAWSYAMAREVSQVAARLAEAAVPGVRPGSG